MDVIRNFYEALENTMCIADSGKQDHSNGKCQRHGLVMIEKVTFLCFCEGVVLTSRVRRDEGLDEGWCSRFLAWCVVI